MTLCLACALYARGRIGKIAAAEMAGVDFFTFQRELSERQVPLYTKEMLASGFLNHFGMKCSQWQVREARSLCDNSQPLFSYRGLRVLSLA